MSNCFLITTYNRKESCQRLVDALQGLGDIVVIGDAVDYTVTGCEFHNLPIHNGRRGYFRTVNELWARRGKWHKYFFMLPDDFLISELQVKRAIEIWESITETRKICLNLFTDRIGKACWTRVLPVDRGDVWQTGWVDMCFLAENQFFSAVSLKEGVIGHSSGVGSQVSRTLHQHKYRMFQVKESLVTIQPEHTISKMHEKENIGCYSKRPKQGKTFDTRHRKPR